MNNQFTKREATMGKKNSKKKKATYKANEIFLTIKK